MLKIIHIDDSKFTLNITKNVLLSTFEPCEVISYTNYEFIQHMKAKDKLEDADILFVDLMMPEITGHDIIKYVRNVNSQLFIVVLSSNVQYTEKEKAFGNGANYFVEKPATTEKLEKVKKSFFYWKDNRIVDNKISKMLFKLINLGLNKASTVLTELIGSPVKLNVGNIYLSGEVNSLSLFSDQMIVQETEGDLLNGKTVFSMPDNELMKLLLHLEVIDNIDDYYSNDNLEMILDTYQEIGNIILGNIISTIANNVKERVNIKLPYISGKGVFTENADNTFIITDISFNIDLLNASGKLYMINCYETFKKVIERMKEIE